MKQYLTNKRKLFGFIVLAGSWYITLDFFLQLNILSWFWTCAVAVVAQAVFYYSEADIVRWKGKPASYVLAVIDLAINIISVADTLTIEAMQNADVCITINSITGLSFDHMHIIFSLFTGFALAWIPDWLINSN